MITLICGILIFCLMIFPHELGHFLTAKACGVKVNEFSMGMGPAIYKKQKGETLYALRAVPIGGYCAMEGEDEDSEDPRAFDNKTNWQKAIILAAGSVMNFLVALIIIIGLTFYTGVATTTLEVVTDDSPAMEAGLQKGDVITAVNGEETGSWTEVTGIIGSAEEGDTLTLTVDRNGKQETLTSKVEKSEDGRSVIGVECHVSHNFFACLEGGFKSTGRMIATLGQALRQIFTGQVGMDQLGGPVAIVKVAGDAGKNGIATFLYLAAFISINLGVFNLLPFPALDGGRLVFLVIRKVTGKRVTKSAEAKVHFIGIVLLLALMVYVTWNDISRLFTG